MSSYLLSFDLRKSTREEFIESIDSIEGITNWLFFFDNTACLVSELSAHELTDLIREKMPQAHFIVSGLERSKRGGWLRKSIWNFIKDPKPVSG